MTTIGGAQRGRVRHAGRDAGGGGNREHLRGRAFKSTEGKPGRVLGSGGTAARRGVRGDATSIADNLEVLKGFSQ